MDWDAIGAIGQAVSALALVIVIVQIRHSRSESRRALSQGRAEAIRDTISQFADERIASIWTKAMIALDVPIAPVMAALMEQAKLTREEAHLFVIVSRTVWSYVLQVMPNVDELPAIERSSFEETIRFHYGTNGPSRIFYECHIKSRDHPDAVRYVESVLSQPN